MNSIEEFDIAILGEEPAGVWLLSQLHRRAQEVGRPLRLGWFKTGFKQSPIAFPAPFAKSFRISGRETWNIELLFAHDSLRWSLPSLKKSFPNLPWRQLERYANEPLGRVPETVINRVVRQSPELLSLSQGVWKIAGRTPNLRPQSLVAAALGCHEMTWWQPSCPTDAAIKAFQLGAESGTIADAKWASNGAICLQLDNHHSILTKHLVVNLNAYQYQRLLSPIRFFSSMGIPVTTTSFPSAQYELKMQVDRVAVPCAAAPAFVYYDVGEIPDPHLDLWPFFTKRSENESEIQIRVTGTRPVALEFTLDRLKNAIGRLGRVLPFLPRSINQMSLPLGVEQCFSHEAREALIEELMSHSWELASVSSGSFQTSHKAVSWLGTSQLSYLPYPIGSLSCAKALYYQLVSGFKLKKPPPKAKSNVSAKPASA